MWVALRPAVGSSDWLGRINLFFTWRLADIEYHTVGVSQVTARDRRVLLYHGATSCDELPLGLLNAAERDELVKLRQEALHAMADKGG